MIILIILKIIRVYNHLKSTIAEHMISQPPEDRLIGGVDCIVEGIECTNLHLTDSWPYGIFVCKADLEVLMLSVSQFDPNDPDDLVKAAWQTIDRMVY